MMAKWARKKRRTRAVACWTSTLAWDGERVRAVAPTTGEGVVNGQGLTLAEVARLLLAGQGRAGYLSSALSGRSGGRDGGAA